MERARQETVKSREAQGRGLVQIGFVHKDLLGESDSQRDKDYEFIRIQKFAKTQSSQESTRIQNHKNSELIKIQKSQEPIKTQFITKMNKRTIHCERSEQPSRVKRVMESETHKDRINLRELRGVQSAVKVHKAIIDYQFQEVFKPHWFGSIQWQPFIADYTEAEKEARHFRNKFLCALLNTKPTKIPNPPDRPRMIWFHEKAPVLVNPNDTKNPRYKIAYHSHFHLGECPRPYDSLIQLDWLISNKVGKGFHRLSTNKSKENKGFVLKPWVEERHAHYNLKDYYRFKHQQDADLVLDITRNSDIAFSRD